MVKTPRDLSARSTIMCLLEVFCEHGVPSFIHTDRGRNFVSKDFSQFCQDLGIHLNFSSGYHHSANQAKRAVCTVKDLVKHCFSASVHLRIALLEYLCTPGPSGKSHSELLYRQFRGIIPMLNDSSSCVSDANKLAERQKEEKDKFDVQKCELKLLIIGSVVSYLNADLKTWSVGKIHGRSSDNRSYEILIESGLIVLQNRIHIRETNVVFREHVPNRNITVSDHTNSICKNTESKALKSSPVPTAPPNPNATDLCVKTTKHAVASKGSPYRTHSGRKV